MNQPQPIFTYPRTGRQQLIAWHTIRTLLEQRLKNAEKNVDVIPSSYSNIQNNLRHLVLHDHETYNSRSA